MFLQIFLFLLGCLVCWRTVVRSSVYDPLYFCGISYNVSFFIYNFDDLGPPFSLIRITKKCQFCLSLKNTLSLSDHFFFLLSVLFISALICIIPFLLLTLAQFILFLVS